MGKHKSKKKKPQTTDKPVGVPALQAAPDADKKAEDAETSSTKEESSKEAMFPMLRKIYNVVFRDKAAAWTAIFTCVLAIFSYLLWKVSSDANNTSTATQAASVSAIGPSITKLPSDDGKTLKGYNVTFLFANSGTTPTRTITMQSNVTIGRNVPNSALDFNSLPQSTITTAVLGPKAGIQTTPVFVRLQDFEDVAQNKTHMFFWGWAVYKDVFSDTPHLSEYCFDIQGVTWTKPDHTDLVTDMSLNNPPCGVHFCFNEECEDYKTRTK